MKSVSFFSSQNDFSIHINLCTLLSIVHDESKQESLYLNFQRFFFFRFRRIPAKLGGETYWALSAYGNPTKPDIYSYSYLWFFDRQFQTSPTCWPLLTLTSHMHTSRALAKAHSSTQITFLLVFIVCFTLRNSKLTSVISISLSQN